MKLITTILVACFALAARDAGSADMSGKSIPIFHIGKNTNKNQVHYTVNVNPDCTLNEDEPVSVFWRRRQTSPTRIKPLKWAERKFAYGIHFDVSNPNYSVFTLSADDSRPVVIETSAASGECQIKTETKILGQWITPDHAFTKIKERRFMFPKILYVEIRGRNLVGDQICERVLEPGKPGIPCPKN